MKRQDFRFFHRLRVRWAEVDMQKIVFNAHYLMYLDTAMADYWRALAMPYELSMKQLGGDLYVKKATLEYHASALYDDALKVGLKCTRIGTSSIQFTAAVLRGDELLVTGELIYVFADPSTQSSQPVPAALRALMEAYEAGEDMVDIRTGSWAELGTQASAVRNEVFVQEQRIPLEMEWDEADATATHAIACNRLGQVLATGRLLDSGAGVFKVGRMAVTRVLRGAQLGSQILHALAKNAEMQGGHEIELHAQTSAQGFYERLGFKARGELFEEVGIPHIEMFLPLEPS